MLFITSCKKEEKSEESGKLFEVTFGVSLFRQSTGPITSDGRSVSSLNLNNQISAIGSGESFSADDPNSGVDYIYYYVYKDDVFVKLIEQTRATLGFGKIVDQLPKGKYKIIVYGSKNPLTMDIRHRDERMVIFSMPGTDVLYENMTIDVDGQLNRMISLDRIMALLKITTDDNIPVAVTKIRLLATQPLPWGDEVPNTMSVLTGLAYQPSGDYPGAGEHTITIGTADHGKPLTFSVYIFGTTTDNPNIDVVLNAYDSGNQKIYSATIDGISMSNGMQTNLEGPLFSNVLLDGAVVWVPGSSWAVKETVNF